MRMLTHDEKRARVRALLNEVGMETVLTFLIEDLTEILKSRNEMYLRSLRLDLDVALGRYKGRYHTP